MRSTKVLGTMAVTVIKLTVTALVVFLVYTGATKAYEFGFAIFAEIAMEADPGRDINVTIIEGKTVMEIGEILEEKGLIEDAKLFYFQEKFSKYAKDLKPGAYDLNTSMTPDEIMRVMAAEKDTEG